MFKANRIGIPRDSKGNPFAVPRLLRAKAHDVPGYTTLYKDEWHRFAEKWPGAWVVRHQWCPLLHHQHEGDIYVEHPIGEGTPETLGRSKDGQTDV